MRRVLAALLLAAVIAAGCTDDDLAGDQGRLRVDGSAEVTSSSGAVEVVTDTATLAIGDTVVVVEGTGSVELADGSHYQLRSGVPGSTLEMAIPPRLLGGDVLVDDGFPAAVAVGELTLTAMGALAVDLGASTAEAYAGRTRVAGLSGLEVLDGLRQVALTEGSSPAPIAYDGTDEWDRRYLGEAIAFGERLEALARGYTNEIQPGTGRDASFFESVLPALRTERDFGDDLLDGREPGETLVGAAIVVQGRRGTFRSRWDQVFGFRDEGAAWGLVALDQGVSAAPVLQTIELAVAESPLSADPRPSTTTTTAPFVTTTAPTTATTGTTTTTSTTTTTTPVDPPGLLDPVLDPAREVVEDLFDALGLG